MMVARNGIGSVVVGSGVRIISIAAGTVSTCIHRIIR